MPTHPKDSLPPPGCDEATTLEFMILNRIEKGIGELHGKVGEVKGNVDGLIRTSDEHRKALDEVRRHFVDCPARAGIGALREKIEQHDKEFKSSETTSRFNIPVKTDNGNGLPNPKHFFTIGKIIAYIVGGLLVGGATIISVVNATN